jgi:uncharacterized membrane protein YfcA
MSRDGPITNKEAFIFLGLLLIGVGGWFLSSRLDWPFLVKTFSSLLCIAAFVWILPRLQRVAEAERQRRRKENPPSPADDEANKARIRQLTGVQILAAVGLIFVMMSGVLDPYDWIAFVIAFVLFGGAAIWKSILKYRR